MGEIVEQRSTAAAAALIPIKREVLRASNTDPGSLLWKRRLAPAALILSDTSLAFVVWGVASVLQGLWGRGDLSGVAIASMVPVIALWVGLRGMLGLYPGYGLDSAEELRRHTYSVFAAPAVLATFALGFKVGSSFSRLLLGFVFLGLLFLAPFARYLVRQAMKAAGLWGKPVVVLSYKENGVDVVRLLKDKWELGYNPVAIFDFHLDMAGGPLKGVGSEQILADVVDLAREQRVDTAIFAMPHIRREQLAKLVSLASVSFRHVLIMPNLSGITNSSVVARDFAGTFAVEIKHNLLDPWAQRVKRSFDLFGAVVGGLFICPILLLIFMLIKLDSPGPAIFVQERPGQNGKMFRIYKFRTMYTDAEQRFDQLILENDLLAKEFDKHGKLRDDPRVTRVGRWLRRFSLDELPQLWNVLKGNMSLVGPRPYLVNQAIQMEKAGVIISRVPPGITGLWQVSGRSEVTLQQRIDLDISYVRNWSIWLDLVLLARTALCVLLRRGAY